jgi:hypothetical protein
MVTIRIILCDILLITFTILCEKLPKLTAIQWQKVVIDNLVHGAIGGLVWWTAVQGRFFIGQICTCAVLASAIDVDHFIAAASLSLEVKLSFHDILLFVWEQFVFFKC